jgi:hypothetical protein
MGRHTAFTSIRSIHNTTYKMLEFAKIEKSEVLLLAPAFCGFFAAPSVREALGAEHTEAAGGGLRGSN